MEKPSSNPSSFTLLISFMVFLFLNKFYSISKFFFQPHLDFVCCKSTSLLGDRSTADSEFVKHKVSLSKEGEELNGEDVEMVMRKLRVICDNNEDVLHQRLGWDEMSVLFDGEEPSVEEVKEAFLVFDENRDGFIDDKELQRVLCCLGLKQGSEINECRKMITAFDENRDGRIDFNEFVKLMEKSFY